MTFSTHTYVSTQTVLFTSGSHFFPAGFYEFEAGEFAEQSWMLLLCVYNTPYSVVM
jgi:hypothetical protein